MSRLSGRLDVLARALVHQALGTGRRQPPAKVSRILIAHRLLLGDTLMLTPLLAKLRSLYPQAEIVMTAAPAIVPLYAKRPFDVDVLSLDLRDRATMHRLFAQSGFDLAIVPGDNRHAWLARALDAKWIVAHAGDTPAWKNWPVDAALPYPDQAQAWGDLVAGLVDGPDPQPFRTEQWPAPDAADFDRPHGPYAVLHIGASTAQKRWPAERWRALAEVLARDGLTVVLSGGKGEEALTAAVNGSAPAMFDVAGRLSLPQLWHLLADARILVCPDTGIAHLGRIVGVPTVTLFGPGSALLCGAGRYWADAPYHPVFVADMPCRDQTRLFRREIPWVRRCGRGDAECAHPRCMEAIEVDAVLATCRTVLSNRVHGN